MRVKVLSLALLAAIIALPVPASQLLTGTFSAPTPIAAAAPVSGALATLVEDPFLAGHLTFQPVSSVLDTEL
jgi:hypothetical protein